MSNLKRTALAVLASAALVFVLAGCNRGGTSAGEKLDNALEKTGEAVENAGEAIKPK